MQYKKPTGHKSDEHAASTSHHLDDRAQAQMTRWDGVKILFFLMALSLGAYATGVTEVLV